MDDDHYEYDERTYTLNGVHTRRTIRLGDSVKVQVASANVETRKIDLVFAD
jgi:ribonuclease R